MMPAATPRSLAILLLRFAIRIAPHDALDWGRAMLSELHQVEGNWAALLWSLGGAGVLAKHAVLALILPGSHRSTVASANELFAKETPVRKSMLYVTAGCVLASLLFFLVPVFRQAFHVSLAQWHDVLHLDQRWLGPQPDPELQVLAQKAERNHDAEALAFVAIRITNPRNQAETFRLADEAVHLNPALTWVYAIVGTPCPTSDKVSHWIPALEQWDPQNALPYLIVAEKMDCEEVLHGLNALKPPEKSPAWKEAMAAAFQSPKLDTYSKLQKDLDRRVLLRYQIRDPFEAMMGSSVFDGGLPSYAVGDSYEFAKSLLEFGRVLESHGDRKSAVEKYLTVARYDQMLGGITGEFFVAHNLEEAYMRLSTLSEGEGNRTEAAFYAALRDDVDRAAKKDFVALRSRPEGSDVTRWNALLIRLSGLVMLLCACLVVVCLLGVVVRRKTLRLSALDPGPLTLTLGLVGAVGAVLSGAVLYVSYRPYAEILQRFIDKGDETSLSELSNFLGATQAPLGTRSFLGVHDAIVQFWIVVTALCFLAVLIAVVRHLQTRSRATAVA